MAIDDVLQELVIKLGLDPAPLRKGAEAAAKDLDKLDKGAGKTQGKVKSLSTETSDFGKKGADAFAAVRREALSYFAIVTGGRGLTSFIRDTTKASVSLDNLSRQLGISRQNLLQYRYALEAVGSDGGGYEKLLATIQAMSKNPDGIRELNRVAPQLGVKLLNDDNSVRSDILDQLHRSRAFQRNDRGNQQLLLSRIGGNSDLLNLIDSPRYKAIVNSPEFQGLAPTEEQVRQSKQLLEDWIKFQAETSKIFSRVYSDIQPVADTIVKGLTAIERSNPRAVATGLEVLAGAIVALGTAAFASPLVKGGKKGAGAFAKILGALGLGKIGEFLWGGLKEGVKGAPRLAGGALAAEAAETGAIAAPIAAAGAPEGPPGWAAAFVATILSVIGYEAYKHDKHVRGGVDWLGGKIKNSLSPIVKADHMARIRNTLERGGLNKFEVAGLLANISTESGFDPEAVPPNGEPAYGLLQWHPDRQKEFKRVFGHDIRQSTLEEQAEFILHERQHTEKAAFKAIERARSAREAGAAASLYYVRPFAKEREARERADLAEQISASLNASSGGNAQTNHFNVTLGDINVTSHAANPAHVANEVNASTSGHLKATLDEFRKSIVQQNAGGIY